MRIIKESDKDSIKDAITILDSGGVIAFATDTTYGIACDARNDLAVKKLYKLKNRQESKPIAIFVQNLDLAKTIVQFDKKSTAIANNFMPGALTLILNKNNKFSKISNLLNNSSLDIGIRIPNHQFSLKLLEKFTGILAVTSANISNKMAATNISQVENYFGKSINLMIDGGNCHKKSSTVLKVNINGEVQILRQGPITKKQILSALDNEEYDK